MEPPGVRFQKYLSEQLKKFMKTPFVIPAILAITAGVYYLVILYGGTICFIGLLPPLTLLGLSWYSGFKGIKKLALIGVMAALVFSGVFTGVHTDQYQHLQYKVGASNDEFATHALTNGTRDPLFGDKSTIYQFSVTVHLNNSSFVARDVSVLIQWIAFPSVTSNNYTMVRQSTQIVNNTTGEAKVTYVYNTTLSTPVNMYVFWANISGVWYIAADYSQTQAQWLYGPITKDTGAILALIWPIAIVQEFATTLPIYLLILVMIWWTRKTRKMRKTQMEKWEEERAKEEAKKPKDDAKVSLQRRAMGLDDGGTFVCSECGADVPSDATVCPKCGEKFE